MLSFITRGVVLGAVFAVYPSWDMRVAAWLFDPPSAQFPLAGNDEWNVVRRVANWLPYLMLVPAAFVLVRKQA
jgi:hypothetical protein